MRYIPCCSHLYMSYEFLWAVIVEGILSKLSTSYCIRFTQLVLQYTNTHTELSISTCIGQHIGPVVGFLTSGVVRHYNPQKNSWKSPRIQKYAFRKGRHMVWRSLKTKTITVQLIFPPTGLLSLLGFRKCQSFAIWAALRLDLPDVGLPG